MAKRVLLGCYEVPGWGGAATSHYQLFERMQSDGWDVAYVNLVSDKDAAFLRPLFGQRFGNPRGLANVQTCVLRPPIWDAQPCVAQRIGEVAPDRKSTRLNSSHQLISYAVFCLKKK